MPITQDKILEIVKSVGKFASYKGLDGETIYGNSLQAVLAKQMLQQLSPKEGWEVSPVTELAVPLAQQQDNDIITIGSGSPYLPTSKEAVARAFGEAKCTISKQTLKKLAETASIVTNPNMVTPELFLAIQNHLISRINPQEKRTLKTIINSDPQLVNLFRNHGSLGYASQEALDKVLNMPLSILGSNICHSQEVHFFVEQEKQAGQALNKLKQGSLDQQTPCVLLSIPGINLSYGGFTAVPTTDGNDIILHGSVSAKQLANNMWKSVLDSALLQGCNNIVMPAIGLGAFAGKLGKEIANIYFEELFKLLQDPQYQNQFNVLFNPTQQYTTIFNEKLRAYENKIQENGCSVQAVDCDTKMLAVEFAKQGHKCALLNPSDMDVVLGKYDVGEYYKQGHYVGEEDLAATSTAAIGSRGISDCYTNRSKIIATTSLEAKENKTAQVAPATLNSATLASSCIESQFDQQGVVYYSENCQLYFNQYCEQQIDNIQNTKYIPAENPTKENNYTVGELRSIITEGQSTEGELLAVVKYGLIECPKTKNSENLIDAQYEAFIAFLKIESALAVEDHVTININYFSPKELECFLKKLNEIGKMPNIILELPSSSEQCIYGDNQCYTSEQYNTAKLALQQYNKQGIRLTDTLSGILSEDDRLSTASSRRRSLN